MTVSTVTSNKKSSKVARKPRPVENQVIKNEEAKQEEVYTPKFGNDVYLTEMHHATRILVKRLFSCKDQESVDRVVKSALDQNVEFEEAYQQNPRFELRIRNAEIQVRHFLEAGYDLKKVNPVMNCIRLETIFSKTTVSSWGHLADRLLKGYKVLL